MDGESVSEVLTESAAQVYQYISDMQYVTDPPLGVSITGVTSYDVGDGFAVLHIDGRMPDPNGLMLMVDDLVLREDEAGFDRYDETSRTMVVRPDVEVLRKMAEGSPKVFLLADMRFLVSAVGEFYRRYGHLLALPSSDVVCEAPRYPGGLEPNLQQIEAVMKVLTNRLCYVWGAPGTGKTQYVLATCIRSVVGAGGRVAVFAPTNNSVEQVLRGLIKSFGEDSDMAGSILRLGIPTNGFYRDYPWMCEDRQAQRRLESCIKVVECLEDVLYERAFDCLEGEILDAMQYANDASRFNSGHVLLEDIPELRDWVEGMRPLLSIRPETRDLLRAFGERDASDVLSEMHALIYDRQRPGSEIEEYSEWSDADILMGIIEAETEIAQLRSKTQRGRVEEAKIIATTPHQFISRFRPRGSEEDGRQELDVDHIFLDEAGYCGLMQAAALLCNGVPVTFLGDHMQLPPVSQLDDELLRTAAEHGGRLSYGCLWSMPSLFCEQLISRGPGSLSRSFIEMADPEFRSTARCDLTQSHRFGKNLAEVLDEFVYHNGVSGFPDGGNLSIEFIEAVCSNREGRDNVAEAEAVREFLRREMPDPEDVAILTPYSVQSALLKRKVGRRYRDCVMTVHGSQGREWDTVVLSVADNGMASRDVPLRFTSSLTPMGMKVVNTAVSRAKRRLVIVCDSGFWAGRPEELLGGILSGATPVGRHDAG